MNYFAGIGSRETPEDILQIMTKIASSFTELGYILRSGGAKGADKAFELGVINNNKEIFYSNDATKESINLALEYHPNPTALKRKGSYVLGLMGRNMQIVLGKNLDKPVDFLISWTRNGKLIGGAAQAMRYCEENNIQVYNLFYKEQLAQLRSFYESIKRS